MFGKRSRQARRDALPALALVDVLATAAAVMAVDPGTCEEFDTGDRLLARLGTWTGCGPPWRRR